MRNVLAGMVAISLVSVAAQEAQAAFHLMSITEVFPGSQLAPNAQYIELQMYAAGQNLVDTHRIRVYNATGTEIASFMFDGNVASGANQATLLIATTEAQALFGVTPDLVMTASLPLAGGKVCFDTTIDCVAWGNYTGNAAGVGAPALEATGLRKGQSLTRRLNVSGGATTLEAADDTGSSANDFVLAGPTPRNNAGNTATIPTSTCGNNNVEGLEECDQNNTTDNDGCSSACITELCGDAIVQTAEQCDDGDLNNNDTCSSSCMTQTALVDAGVADAPAAPADAVPPDTGNGVESDAGINLGDDIEEGCCQTGTPGTGALLSLLTLGLVLRRRRR